MRAIFLLATMLLGVNASATCYISLPVCPANPGIAPPNSTFPDKYDAAEIISNRCLQRAREYQAYCRLPPNLSVGAYFYSSAGAPVVAIVVTGGESQLYSTDAIGGRWLALTAK